MKRKLVELGATIDEPLTEEASLNPLNSYISTSCHCFRLTVRYYDVCKMLINISLSASTWLEIAAYVCEELFTWFLRSGEVRESRGVWRSQEKSGKTERVRESQGIFKSTGLQKSIIVFSIYILALKSEMSDFKAEMYQIQFRLGLQTPYPRPQTPLEELTALPQTNVTNFCC